MASHANWLRVMIALSLQAFEREPGKPDIPILLMLDEFPVLGYMRSIEAAAGQIAGFGVKLWTVLQDLGQIKKLYQSSWETFVGNAGVLTFFGNTDLTTLRYVSAKLGKIGMNLERASRASGPDLARGVNPIQEDLRESALLEPHEVELTLARETGRVLVLAAGRKPLILQRARYYADRPFAACSTTHGRPPAWRGRFRRESRHLRGLCGEVRLKREEQVTRTWHTKGPLRIGVDRESRHPLKVEFDEYSWPEKRTHRLEEDEHGLPVFCWRDPNSWLPRAVFVLLGKDADPRSALFVHVNGNYDGRGGQLRWMFGAPLAILALLYLHPGLEQLLFRDLHRCHECAVQSRYGAGDCVQGIGDVIVGYRLLALWCGRLHGSGVSHRGVSGEPGKQVDGLEGLKGGHFGP